MGLFKKLIKTGIRVATTPVAVVADAATLGGLNTGRNETYTGERLRKIGDDLKEVEREIDDL